MRRWIANVGCAVVLATALTTEAVGETSAEMVYRWLIEYCRAIPEPDQQWECWTALARESMRATAEATRNARDR